MFKARVAVKVSHIEKRAMNCNPQHNYCINRNFFAGRTKLIIWTLGLGQLAISLLFHDIWICRWRKCTNLRSTLFFGHPAHQHIESNALHIFMIGLQLCSNKNNPQWCPTLSTHAQKRGWSLPFHTCAEDTQPFLRMCTCGKGLGPRLGAGGGGSLWNVVTCSI